MLPLDAAIRAMEENDISEIATLEAMAGDVRWTQAQIAVEWKKPIARYFIALAPGERFIGYAGGWIVVPELQIANIVIHPEFRGRGIGRRLLETLLAQAGKEGCSFSTLEVRRSNAHAQALYHAAGFKETGTRPKVYEHPDEDALLMEKSW